MNNFTYEEKGQFLDACTTLADAAKEIAKKMPEPEKEEPISRHRATVGALKRISKANIIINNYLDDELTLPPTKIAIEQIKLILNDLYPTENSS